jgi:hypothetical protein
MECYEKYDRYFVCVTDLVRVRIRDFADHIGVVIGIRLMEPCIHVAIKNSNYFFYAYDLEIICSERKKTLDNTPKGD